MQELVQVGGQDFELWQSYYRQVLRRLRDLLLWGLTHVIADQASGDHGGKERKHLDAQSRDLGGRGRLESP
jgi:hypothetical protein